MVGIIGQIGRIGRIGGGDSSALAYLASRGLSEFNAGGDYNAARYWRPSNPLDHTSPPVWCSEAEHFAQFAREGSKWAFNAAGVLVQYGANVPAFEWQGGKRKYLNEGASTRITPYPATPLTNWGLSGATKSAYAGTFMGLFSNACEVVSTGGSWNRVSLIFTYSLTAGVPVSWTCVYRAGTSGRCRVILRNVTASTETHILGLVGNLAVSTTDAGTATVVRQYQVPDGSYVIEGTWTPNANGTSFQLGIGPDSATDGQTVIAVGGWVETSRFPTSPILSNPASQATRAADNFRLSPAHEAVLQNSGATALVGGTLSIGSVPATVLGTSGGSRIFGSNSGVTQWSVGETSSLNPGAILADNTSDFRMCVGYTGASKAASLNGNAVVSNNTSIGIADMSQIFLGRSSTGRICPILKVDINVAAPAQLPDARLQQVAVFQ